MENNKYYTPTIEEFHVGFEYEIDYGDEWVSETQFDGFLHNKKLENIRVKYLDKEDIESLGFESIGSGWYNLKVVPGSLGYFLYVRLQRWGEKTYIKAYRQDPATTDFDKCEYCDKEDLVSGAIIKNKSELKKLMKQLGIYE